MTFISQSINIWRRIQQETSWSQCHVRTGRCILVAVTAELEFLGAFGQIVFTEKIKVNDRKLSIYKSNSFTEFIKFIHKLHFLRK